MRNASIHMKGSAAMNNERSLVAHSEMKIHD